MINFKQKELVRNFFKEMKEKFPETEFVSLTEGPENPADLWINITALEDEDKEEELIAFASDKTSDILLDYGYYITIMTRRNSENSGGMKYQEIFA
ncbi:Uncharacterized protein dnl_43820 [Desulfonema limicola]|jgi:hypothetical protein|uniref:Uncharacterized protein n=1 Tax=Desulfonema limicola TaxID=45656 RepID=A0A975BAL5_9BACT|nr:hypothetical protein [Desulfonema limicola]QTA82021.1 Uncharacterized protein dnl_43820 [Desulfonema limicola]